MIIVALLGVVAVLFILGMQLGNQALFASQVSARWVAHEQSYYIVRSIVEQAIHLIPPQNAPFNSLQDAWAGPIPPLPIDGKVVQIQIEDEERRFDLNAMRRPDGSIDQNHLDQFTRLLAVLQSSNVGFANAVADWEDADSTVRYPGGAESLNYRDYPCKNGPLDSVAELLDIQGCSPQLYDGTAASAGVEATPSPSPGARTGRGGVPGLRYVCTVHSSGKVNVNTAFPAVLQSIADGMPPSVAQAIVQRRSEQPFKSLNDLLSVPGFDIKFLYRFQQLAEVK